MAEKKKKVDKLTWLIEQLEEAQYLSELKGIVEKISPALLEKLDGDIASAMDRIRGGG